MTRNRWWAASLLGSATMLMGCPDTDVSGIDPFGETDPSGGSAVPTSGTGGIETAGTDGTTAMSDSASVSISASDSDTTTGSDTNPDPSVGETSAGSTSGDSTTGDPSGGSTTGPVPDCTMDTDCPLGEICEAQECVPGCSAAQPCPGGDACCDGVCIDTQTDVDNCMMCGVACPDTLNAADSCEGGQCVVGDCDPGWYDCDGVAGCESQDECACEPGVDLQSCYPGPPGTEGVGICQAGQRTCNAQGTGWGPCIGYVLPEAEFAAGNCGNGIDDDCNGAVDDVDDIDGDGWTLCNGDCCEDEFTCSEPALVNPGAFEFVGNGVDDDCDPATSDAVPTDPCSNAALFNGVSGTAVAQAMDLCQFTTENEPLPTRKWGVISADFVMPDGSAPPGNWLNEMQNYQAAILQNYGTGGVLPTLGATMAGLSSGLMRDQDDPDYAHPNGGVSFGNNTNPPPSYLAANGGSLPASQGCSGNCPAGNGANDPVAVRLRIRVPTNAQSFRYRFRYFSAEYWTYQCTAFNDFYLALLDSEAPGIPADGNISFDSLGNPVSVNNGFFDICTPYDCNLCPEGNTALQGTGMQLNNTGGGTVWLETTAPVVPGETIELTLMVFDVSDNILDSLVLLDAFEWDIEPSDVGTQPQPQ